MDLSQYISGGGFKLNIGHHHQQEQQEQSDLVTPMAVEPVVPAVAPAIPQQQQQQIPSTNLQVLLTMTNLTIPSAAAPVSGSGIDPGLLQNLLGMQSTDGQYVADMNHLVLQAQAAAVHGMNYFGMTHHHHRQQNATSAAATHLIPALAQAVIHQQHRQQQELTVPLVSGTTMAPFNPSAYMVQQTPLEQAQMHLSQIYAQQQQQHLQQQQMHQQHQHFQNQHEVVQNLMAPHNLIPGHLQSTSQAASLDGKTGYPPATISPNIVDANTLLAAAAVAAAAANNSNGAQPTAMGQIANPHGQFPVTIPLSAPTMAPQSIIQALSTAHLPAPQPSPVVPLTVQDRNATIFPPPTPVYQGINLNYVTTTGKRPRQVHANPPVYLVEDFLSLFECQFLVNSAEGSWTPAPVVGKGTGEISPSRTSTTCYLAREDLPDYLRKVSALTGKPIEHCELPQVGRYLPSQQYLYVRRHFYRETLSRCRR
jgi:hypothetical protein